jgi:hypothetical protein
METNPEKLQKTKVRSLGKIAVEIIGENVAKAFV